MVEHKTLMESFKHAVDGVMFAIKDNQNLRIHLIAAVLVVVLSVIYKVGAFEMGILGVMILLVISTEMINTSIEEMTNLITREHRAEAKNCKRCCGGYGSFNQYRVNSSGNFNISSVYPQGILVLLFLSSCMCVS